MSEPERTPEHASYAEVQARLRSVAATLRALADTRLVETRDVAPHDTIVTGVGGSEGPARLFAWRLGARFLPLSSFAFGAPHASRLVVFSQGLSPNARLALTDPRAFDECLLVTAVDPVTHPEPEARAFAARLADAGARFVAHGPAVESGMLARFVGPTVAAAAGLRLAAALGGASFDVLEAARVYDAPLDAPALGSPLALVAAGESVEALFGLRWKWLETFGEDPHVFDVLASAHGPLQALYEKNATWLAFASVEVDPLVARLRDVLPSSHVLHRVRVPSDPALAFFAATAWLDAALLATLRARPRDLRRWPGQGADAALYGLGR
ncbi:MAG: hypothetical protein H6720_12650 [Sandaracinus sp.]|nr:hypothetical protein [Myxococcales bacterium]MCB9601179.1 hypothetical protein [Sandaracinus sp.]